MSNSSAQCPKCHRDVTKDESALAKCPHCGELWYNPPQSPAPVLPDLDAQTSAERRRWRLCFWLCFLLTPAAVLLAVLLPNLFKNVVPGSAGQLQRLLAPVGVVGTFALGALGAGYSLAKLHAKPRTTAGLIGATVAFAVGLAVVYVGILFVGCLIAVERFRLFQF